MDKIAAEGVAAKRSQENEIKIASDLGDERASLLQKTIYRLSNPNPIYIAIIVVSVILIIWLSYRYILKPNASGYWYDSNMRQHYICHPKFSNTVDIISNNIKHKGVIVDNMVKIGDNVGIWDYTNIIVFVGGDTLTRVIQ